MIVLEGVSYSYGYGAEIFRSFSASFPGKRISVILGPNGVGKTTLLKLVAGLIRPREGRILVMGKGPEELRRRGEISMVFQDHGLLPWLSVWENVALPLKIRGAPREEIRARASQALERVGMLHASKKLPGSLSGGERQRVALARALASGSKVLLMDEPFSSIDPESRRGFEDLLLSLWASEGLTVLVVTHSIENVLRIGMEVYVLRHRPARVVARLSREPGGVSCIYREDLCEVAKALGEGVGARQSV